MNGIDRQTNCSITLCLHTTSSGYNNLWEPSMLGSLDCQPSSVDHDTTGDHCSGTEFRSYFLDSAAIQLMLHLPTSYMCYCLCTFYRNVHCDLLRICNRCCTVACNTINSSPWQDSSQQLLNFQTFIQATFYINNNYRCVSII